MFRILIPRYKRLGVFLSISLTILSATFVSFGYGSDSALWTDQVVVVEEDERTEEKTECLEKNVESENVVSRESVVFTRETKKEKKESKTCWDSTSEFVQKIFGSKFNVKLFLLFAMILLGYLVGKIEYKGIGLGTAGVFFVALLFGYIGFQDGSYLQRIGLVKMKTPEMTAFFKSIQDLGLTCFITSVGFIAGPRFFVNLRRNLKSYALSAFVIIGSAALCCWAIIKWSRVDAPMMVGILSGALTTTPGFAAAQEAVSGNQHFIDEITVGHAIGYPFGVLGVVFFVQLMPVILRSNIEEEQRKMREGLGETVKSVEKEEKLVSLDPIGLVPFSVAILIGIIIGSVEIPLPGGARFSLATTGGALLTALLLGHFGAIWGVNMRIPNEFARNFREFGLALFLIGAGVPGGAQFVEVISEYGMVLFLFGAIMGTVPMLCGYFFGRYVVKLCLFNTLGSITGGMTSTPGLGALINATKTDDVAAADAATYPCALIFVVLACQILVTFA